MPTGRPRTKSGRKPPAARRIAQALRKARIDAGLTQRALGGRLNRPQSWVWNCEMARRRVNVAEFVMWCCACELDPMKGFDEALASLSRR